MRPELPTCNYRIGPPTLFSVLLSAHRHNSSVVEKVSYKSLMFLLPVMWDVKRVFEAVTRSRERSQLFLVMSHCDFCCFIFFISEPIISKLDVNLDHILPVLISMCLTECQSGKKQLQTKWVDAGLQFKNRDYLFRCTGPGSKNLR